MKSPLCPPELRLAAAPVAATLSFGSARHPADFDLSDADIADAADRAASTVQRLSQLWQRMGDSQASTWLNLQRTAEQHAIALPKLASLAACLNRLCDATWWRRALRKRRRLVEREAIRCGAVHRRASPYVSERALKLHDDGRTSLLKWVESQEVVNLDTGEVVPLEDIYAASLANPSNRRMAMMARIKGIEATARRKGEDAYFLTITAPSRMHAWGAQGQANAKHDGSDPRQVQVYLNSLWRRAMRSLKHRNLSIAGLRTVEPHHDGCPHWHVLVFVAPASADAVIGVLRAYALADSPNEPGADRHRFTVERIDPSKGSALGYVAKYVSKSIDGTGIGRDDETDNDGASASRRIVAWARLWGIRQFQFFGVPPITPMRELYRLGNAPGLEDECLTDAHQACRANDYAAFLAVCEAGSVSLAVRYEDRASSRYRGEFIRAVCGLDASSATHPEAITLLTREAVWCIQPRPIAPADQAAALPWTRFNNCAQPASAAAGEPPPWARRQPAPAATRGGRSPRGAVVATC